MMNYLKEDMPYEKFERFGSQNLTDAELLAIILRTGTKEFSAIELGQMLIGILSEEYGGLKGLHRISLKQLEKVKGIGRIKAIKLKCIAELSRRIAKEDTRTLLQFTMPQTIAEYYMEDMRHLNQEQVLLLLLDNKTRLLKELYLTKGTINSSLLSARDIFIEALKAEAVQILLIHNHPSGDPTPSRMDLEITQKISECGKLMDIPLIDHIIIGDNKYRSFKEAGII